MEQNLTVVKNEKNPEPDAIIASAIIGIDEAMRKLNAGPLKRETIVLLLHDSTKIARRDINFVLNALDRLKAEYLKPQPVSTSKK